MFREIGLLVGLVMALPAVAGEMTASEGRNFVTEKLFSYSCFDGTRGGARVHLDGSVDGSIKVRGAGQTELGTMPAPTPRVDGERVCGSLPDSIMQPCFYLERMSADTFRGSISGLSFAYCDFTRFEERVVRGRRQHRPFSQTADK